MNARIYVAGPFGFTEPGRRYLAQAVLPALRSEGLVPLDPWEVGGTILGPVLQNPNHTAENVIEACARVGAANAQMIHQAAGLIALIDGCDLDSGTCAEIG